MRGGMRNPMPEQPADVRNKNFEEVALGYDMATAIDEAQRCLNCPKPRCVDGCPVNVEIPAFIQALAQSQLDEAISILKRKNSLAGSLWPRPAHRKINAKANASWVLKANLLLLAV